jgi:hypothetical protein
VTSELQSRPNARKPKGRPNQNIPYCTIAASTITKEKAVKYYGALSSRSSFSSANMRLISFSVRVGGTMRANIAPICLQRQHVTKSNSNGRLTNVHRPPKRSTHATPFLPKYVLWLVGSSSISASTTRKIALDTRAT